MTSVKRISRLSSLREHASVGATSGDATARIFNGRPDELSRLLLDDTFRQGDGSEGQGERSDRIAIGILGQNDTLDGHWRS